VYRQLFEVSEVSLMKERQIQSISDMVKHLTKIIGTSRGPAWCRGHADSDWKLEPHYDRLKKPIKEMELLNRFRQNANLLLQHAPIGPFDFGWMFLMQHYGVPTRLLDWSESPLAALYFAVEDPNPTNAKKDGALWVLFPLELNRHSTKAEVYIPSFEDEWLQNYSFDQYRKAKDNGILPLAAMATRNNPRIQAQSGVFTISHLKKSPIEETEGGKHSVKIIIPAASKERLRQEMRLLGINRFSMFPELASIGDTLRSELK
jgi:FRG domain